MSLTFSFRSTRAIQMFTSALFCLMILLNGYRAKEDEKRLVLHSNFDIEQAIRSLQQVNAKLKNEFSQLNASMQSEISRLNQSIKDESDKKIQILETEIATLKNNYGSTYIRWGRTVCNGNGTQKVYSGFAGGSPHNRNGGASSYVCLPEYPKWASFNDGLQNLGGFMYGAEYQTHFDVAFGITAFGSNMLDQDVPCVVCESKRSQTMMIPGTTDCFHGWSMEYTGYLMTGYSMEIGGTDFACVDKRPEAVFHGESYNDGKLFYFTEIVCGSLPC